MNIQTLSTKDIGTLGEKIAAEYLRRRGFTILARNVSRKTGEIDIIAQKADGLHFVEVKSLVCKNFPSARELDAYVPGDNLHANKIRKIIRTAELLIGEERWEGDWQIDAALVWIRERDGVGKVRFLPQIL